MVIIATVGCAEKVPELESRPQQQSQQSAHSAGAALEIDVAARLSKFSEALAMTASIVEGTVSSIDFEYDDWNGPVTLTTLVGTISKMGVPAPSSTAVRVRGGPLPDGRFLKGTELPIFVLNARYVVFLTNRKWNDSAVVDGLALREENVDGWNILVDDDGRVVLGVDAPDEAVLFSDTSVFEPATSLVEERSPRELRPDRGGISLQDALSPSKFFDAIQEYCNRNSIELSGTITPFRDQPYPWNKNPVAPAPDEG